MAEKIVYQVRRTKTLVSSLLSFAKQVPSEKTLLDLNSLTMTTVKLCQPQLRAANIQLRTAMSDNLPQVLGDSNQLLQVCLHVTNNALNAMSQSGGVLAVSTRLHEGWVLLEFSDSGPGIQAPGRVFDPFYTTRPVGQGTGLGLSACYGIIQEHGGRILCENRPEGGATFRIELPPAGASSTRVLAPPSAAGASASAAKG
jgi:two-component system NtrC family sensor kinase